MQMIFRILFWVQSLLILGVVATDRCVDVGHGDFSCTDDALALRNKVDGSTIDVGITQRVDGSESEKKEIREVLQRMDEYFFSEVLAMPEYENVRPYW
jgi:hypothetical protein